VLGGKLPATGRGAGLVQYRRALRRGFAEVDGIELKIRAAMRYAVDPVGIGKFPSSSVTQYRAILPARFPQLINCQQIVLGDLVTLIVAFLRCHTNAAGGTLEIPGNDVSADTAVCQVVQSRHSAGEGIGVLVSNPAGHAKAEIPGDLGHRRDDLQRIVHRDLHRILQRGARRALINVVNAEHIGQK
jgi:hypothetical protein